MVVADNERTSALQDDPFNISGDKAYRTKEGTTTTDLSLKKSIGKKVPGLEHSGPAKKLDRYCFKYSLTEEDLRNFHRPKLKKVRSSVDLLFSSRPNQKPDTFSPDA